ncbi:1-aminocyclopropane-1-carboxylate oxidase homolog 4-like [Carica papaya]|uniref:1-aminocyclopropane-1-carboxylate oxidase homolog 4-like n=1 Tax=Carica papaya TaxID=3649 RepID=UPI000B8CDAF2|nr:1-aminocyclopropane-1-carboxylate oxidase homolog 4-like [Carica papaya]
MATEMVKTEENYDHLKEVKRFDDSKTGVKGLVDSGLSTIPRFFIHPPHVLSGLKPNPTAIRPQSNPIPTVDLSNIDSPTTQSTVVDQLKRACGEFGFFQIVNHGVPVDLLDRMIAAVKDFHEQPTEAKESFYSRSGKAVQFFSNVDLFHSKAASWRDTLQMRLGPELPNLEEVPEMIRRAIVEWNQEIKRLGEVLMELLCEGLGVNPGRLKEMTFLDGRVMVGHYYPYCPQPDLTVGITSHTDPGVLTVLLQSQVGGLQIKHDGEWLDVKPIPGALVINVGDIFQIMSNEEYKSVEHRVLANSLDEPRVSIAVFFNPTARENLYGPFPELISPEKPAIYRQFQYIDYLTRFFTKELDGKSLTNFYKL